MATRVHDWYYPAAENTIRFSWLQVKRPEKALDCVVDVAENVPADPFDTRPRDVAGPFII
jgi:hypothetical protein